MKPKEQTDSYYNFEIYIGRSQRPISINTLVGVKTYINSFLETNGSFSKDKINLMRCVHFFNDGRVVSSRTTLNVDKVVAKDFVVESLKQVDLRLAKTLLASIKAEYQKNNKPKQLTCVCCNQVLLSDQLFDAVHKFVNQPNDDSNYAELIETYIQIKEIKDGKTQSSS